MTTRLYSIIFLIFLPCLLHGQCWRKYEYRRHLESHSSTYKKTACDSMLKNNSVLVFQMLGEGEDTLMNVGIQIKGRHIDTLISSDFDGKVSILLSKGDYGVVMQYSGYSSIRIKRLRIKKNTKTTVTANLGKAYGTIIDINSRRKLKKREINQIVEDYSNGQGEENKLIKNKVCIVMCEL